MNRTIAIVCVLVATLMLVGAISGIIDVQSASGWLITYLPSSSGAGSNVNIQNQVNTGNNAVGQ